MSITLLIRLGDEHTWSCEPFQASNQDELRDGCLEAFANLRTDWTARCTAAIPAHQTRKRASCEAQRPRSLYVQVCHHGEWCAQPWTPVIHEPGSVPNASQAWGGENWGDAWERCVRTFNHIDNLGMLLNWAARQ